MSEVEPLDVDEEALDAPEQPLTLADNSVAPLLNPPSPCSTCG
jgi:hypothetical protein